ncbi:hypothetical protein BCR43DRAFT_487196, partial [Syncephalastrum racemosum]
MQLSYIKPCALRIGTGLLHRIKQWSLWNLSLSCWKPNNLRTQAYTCGHMRYPNTSARYDCYDIHTSCL